MYGVDEKYILDNFDAALENDYIKPYFQPIIRTLTGEICAAETLARWDDPVNGLLPPITFIDTLEKNYLIHKLDLKIIECVCYGYTVLTAHGLKPLPFSVNLSRLDFEIDDIFERITGIFAKYKVPTNAVHLEITESVTIDNTEHFSGIFERFRNAGFQIWMDDFGSGYTSLNVLKDYEFDLLKIDMKFLSSINLRSKKVIASVINTAKSLGMHILAEGVETEAQVSFLKDVGCEMLQGYYYAKPMSADDLVAFINKGKYVVENQNERKYRDAVGMLNFLSANPLEEDFGIIQGNNDKAENNLTTQYPLALLEFCDEKFTYPYVNNAYKREITKLGIKSVEELTEITNDRTKPYYYGTKKQVYSTTKIKGTLDKDYIMGDICYSFTTKYIADTPQKIMLAISLHVFGDNGIENRFNEINKYSNLLFYNYESVCMMYPERDSSKTIYSNMGFNGLYNTTSMRRGIEQFAKAELHEDDRQRYLDFIDVDTLNERVQLGECSFLQQPFRIRTPEKTYRWRLVRITRIPTLSDVCYLYSIQRMSLVDIAVIEKEIVENPDMFK